MEALLSQKTFLESKFETLLSLLEEPKWISELRKSAFALLKETAFPNTTMESWRKVSLSNFSLETLLSPKIKICTFSINTDEIHTNEFSVLDSYDKVYIETTFQTLLEKNKSNFFGLLNLSFFDIGILAKIPQNTNIKDPIRCERLPLVHL